MCTTSYDLIITLSTDLIRDINDPEHPLTLEDLNVVQLERIQVRNNKQFQSTMTCPLVCLISLVCSYIWFLNVDFLLIISRISQVDDKKNYVKVEFTPTIPHCSMATLIGLSIRVQLLRSLPERFKVDVEITPGTHASELAVNKQLNDKERVAAALENSHLLEVVNQCLTVKGY